MCAFELAGGLMRVLARWVPGITVIRTYEKGWFRRDFVAALVLTALLVPQGMAYAELAGLPAVTGLYTTVAALVGYAIFGPSRIMVLGPDSSLAPVIAAIIAPLVIGDSPAEAVALAAMLAILAGLIEILVGVVKLGTITDLLSMPVRIGYLNGIALLVLVSQLPKLFGFSTDGDGFISDIVEFVKGVADGGTVVASLLLGSVAIVVMLVGRRLAPRVPWVLVAVVASIAVVALLGLADEGVSVVGVLPSGFPSPTFPSVPLDDLGPLLAGELAIAIISVADTAALSRSFSAKRGERVDQNHEAWVWVRPTSRPASSGLPDERKLVADGRRRVDGRKDATHRGPVGHRLCRCQRPACRSALVRPRRCGDRRLVRPLRSGKTAGSLGFGVRIPGVCGRHAWCCPGWCPRGTSHRYRRFPAVFIWKRWRPYTAFW